MSDLPNILWIFTDQHRAQAMSCAGDVNIDTPHLDRLANEGIRFSNAYTNTPLCSPSRACIYTGTYSSTHGAFALHVPPKAQMRMLQEELQDLGYLTSHYGKWHMSGGAAPSHFTSPYFRPGWDQWMGWENSNEPWATQYSVGDFPLPIKTLEGYQTDALTNLSLEFIERQKGNKPWFHVLSIEPPHQPNTPPEAYRQEFSHKDLVYRDNVPEAYFKDPVNKEALIGYYGQIKNIDDNIGRILEKLEASNQLNNTIIFYFSDHGDMFGSHNYRGKSLSYVESSQIPLIIRYPKKVLGGQVSPALISTVDFLPTLLGMLGTKAPAYCQGADLSDLVYGLSNQGAEEVLIQFERNFYGVADKDQIYRTLVKGDWIYTYYLNTAYEALYNLEEDPYQMRNLAVDLKDVLSQKQGQRMHKLLRNKLELLEDDFFGRSPQAMEL